MKPAPRPPSIRPRAARALTLLEIMIAVALIGVLLVLVAPSMRELIGMQRLRAVAAQVVTDMQFARSEAVSRNQFLGVTLRNNAAEPQSCYVLFTSAVDPSSKDGLQPADCNCVNPPNNRCGGSLHEVRTAQVERNLDIQLRASPYQPATFAFSPLSGSIGFVQPPSVPGIEDRDVCVEVTRQPRGRLRITVNLAGRPTVCSPDSSVPGYDACLPFGTGQWDCLEPPLP